MIKLWLFVMTSLWPLALFAQEEQSGAIPTHKIIVQVFNFTLFVLILFFLLRKKTIEYFLSRRHQYDSALDRAQRARQEAESHHAEITERLETLNATATESLEKARSEAAELKDQIREEAQKLSKMLREEAERTSRYELERAKTELREELLTQSVKAAQQVLKERLAESDQKRLQTEFVEKIQVVRP